MSIRRGMAIACGLLLAAGCSGNDDPSALEGAAVQTDGVFQMPDPKLGHEYWFAFPLMKNTTDSPLTIYGFKIDKVSRWIRILGYTMVNVDAGTLKGDVPTSWDTAEPFPPDPPGTDLRDAIYRARVPYTINAHRVSSTVGIVRLSLIDSPAAIRATRTSEVGLSGCQVTYRQGGDINVQTLGCQLILGDDQSD